MGYVAAQFTAESRAYFTGLINEMRAGGCEARQTELRRLPPGCRRTSGMPPGNVYWPLRRGASSTHLSHAPDWRSRAAFSRSRGLAMRALAN